MNDLRLGAHYYSHFSLRMSLRRWPLIHEGSCLVGYVKTLFRFRLTH